MKTPSVVAVLLGWSIATSLSCAGNPTPPEPAPLPGDVTGPSPDLIIDRMFFRSFSTSADGSGKDLLVHVKNAGAAATTSNKISVTLWTDEGLGVDPRLAREAVVIIGNLQPGEVEEVTFAGVRTSGKSYFLAVVDFPVWPSKAVGEENERPWEPAETNNARAIPNPFELDPIE